MTYTPIDLLVNGIAILERAKTHEFRHDGTTERTLDRISMELCRQLAAQWEDPAEALQAAVRWTATRATTNRLIAQIEAWDDMREALNELVAAWDQERQT